MWGFVWWQDFAVLLPSSSSSPFHSLGIEAVAPSSTNNPLSFRSRVEKPGRFAASPEIAQWQFAGGFLSRHAREDGKRNEKGERVMVITAFFKVKDEEGSMKGFVDAMG